MRKGRYRKNLLEKHECQDFRQKFEPVLNCLLAKNLSPVEFVSSYVLFGLQTLRPLNWKGACLQKGVAQSALDHFQLFSFRGIPLSVNRTLLAWQKGDYHLKLFFHVPSTEEVLNLQCLGIRCVTCITSVDELGSYVLNERDPLSFTLHDLIHADHFLRDPVQKAVQIGFSRWMFDLWQSTDLQKKLNQNAHFRTAFEYACADMNSHGAHLVKYLKAIFCQADCESLLLDLSKTTNCSLNFQEALIHLNTSKESITHLEILQNELFLKGSTTGQDDKHSCVRAREIAAC